MNYNVQSITNKIEAVEVVAALFNVDILCITEHWMKEYNADCFNINNFKMANCYVRTHLKHGGVCIYVKKDIKCNTVDYLHPLCLEQVCEMTAVHLPDTNTFILVVYRSPSSSA